MVQPINQSILNQIANPGAQGFANLTNVLQNRRARQDQNKLNQLQSMAQYGPIAAGVVDQALSTPDLAARDQIMEQNRQLFEGIGVRFDDKPGTFDDNSLNTLRKGLQAYIPQKSGGRIIEATDERGAPAFVRDTGDGLQRVQGDFTPRQKTPLVSVNTAEQSAEDKEFGKFLVQGFSKINERATSAQDNLQQLQIAKNIDVNTGAMEPLKAWGAAVSQGMGINPESIGLDKADNAQAFNAIMGNVLATKLAAQKGPQTDKDADRMKETLAQLGNTPEAKEFLLNSAIALEERSIEQRDFYMDWKSNKTTLKGADKAWRSYINRTPIMGKNPNTGRPVFFNEFKQAVMNANENVSDDQILKMWRTKYRGR